MKSVKTRTGEFFVDEYGILNAVMFENIKVDYEDALDNFLVIKNLTRNNAVLKLIDLTNNPRFESKAKKFLENKEVQKMTIARAIITGNNVKKISLNFFTKLNTTGIPTKFFTNYAEAISWLKLHQKKR